MAELRGGPVLSPVTSRCVLLVEGDDEKRFFQNHAIMPFVDEYTFRVKQTMKADAPKNESKAKMQTFLAGMKECVPHLGIAAGKRYWNFDSAALDELRAFILELTRHF
ncbi:MAG TPA: DUF3226 domain-containing protein [Ktedonobacteraceae bacterium]|nr:DUF3226 domain-containing protein [Ktedonobacteraceae bacterium]